MTLVLKDVSAMKRPYPKWTYPKYGRPHMSPSYAEWEEKPRLYISIDGETLNENFAFRFDRPSDEYRLHLDRIFEALRIPVGTKARWSQKAGCSCGCSPGFILTIPWTKRRNLTTRRIAHLDFWATLRGEGLDGKLAPLVNADRIEYRAEELAKITAAIS